MLFFAKYLSLHRDIQPFAEYAVTPCMGVWIETHHYIYIKVKTKVTPCMGVWIETRCLQHHNGMDGSHPVWVCGLKPDPVVNVIGHHMSHPVWVCGLKLK